MTKPSAFYQKKKEKEKGTGRENIRTETIDLAKREGITRFAEEYKVEEVEESGMTDTEGIEKRVGSVLGSFLCVRASGRFVDPRLQFLLRLLCRLNWPAKVVDAPETARPCCSILAFFLFRRLYR